MHAATPDLLPLSALSAPFQVSSALKKGFDSATSAVPKRQSGGNFVGDQRFCGGRLKFFLGG